MADTSPDAGDAKVAKWERDLKAASKAEENWRKSVDDVLAVYRDDGKDGRQPTGATTLGGPKTWFNILFSNVQTLIPALWQSMPRPDVRRRFYDADPIGKQAGEVIERALSYTHDSNDFEGQCQAVIQDYTLTGRGVPRVRYKPTMAPQRIPVMPAPMTGVGTEAAPTHMMPDGSPAPADAKIQTDEQGPFLDGPDQIVDQQLTTELVHWDDFRCSPARSWAEVTWIAYRHRPTREELIQDYGDKIGNEVPLTISDVGGDDGEKNLTRAEVWERWDKTTREVQFFAPDHKGGPLKVETDPLGLTGFFPSPRPLYSVGMTDSLVPYPEYCAYEEQARELNEISRRIDKLTKMLRLRGIYDASQPDIATLLQAEDGKMIPTESWQQLVQGGGIESVAMFVPLDMIIKVLAHLLEQREACKQTIYEITGLSDILRGASDKQETATAQSIKSQWGSLRIDARRREVQRMLKDLFRIEAELIAEHFEPSVLVAMTGLQIMPEVIALLRQDGPRSYRIDVETENATQLQEERKDITELLRGIVEFGNGIAPAVQSGVVPMEAAKSMLLAAVRRFKLGREVEDAINQIGQGPVAPQGTQPMVGAPGALPPAAAAPPPMPRTPQVVPFKPMSTGAPA